MSIGDIAKALGVSKTTVSRAISGNGRVAEDTRERVLAFIQEAGYSPNAAARNLVTMRTENIAFSMPLRRMGKGSPFFYECLDGVTSVAQDTGYDVIVIGDNEEQLARILRSRKADGLVLSSAIVGREAIARLARYGAPIVLTGSVDVPEVIQVSYDARAAFRDLSRRMLGAWPGESALLLSPQSYPVNQTRASGYMDAYASLDRHAPRIIWDMNSAAAVYAAFNELYDQGVRNFFCGDDLIAETLLNVIEGGGRYASRIRQGRTGHDGVNIASFHSSHYLETYHPEIPAVVMDPVTLGRCACRMLVRKLRGEAVPATILLEYALRLEE
jgi:DNA-binding LacI/PurR family transcriptional regulator